MYRQFCLHFALLAFLLQATLGICICAEPANGEGDQSPSVQKDPGWDSETSLAPSPRSMHQRAPVCRWMRPLLPALELNSYDRQNLASFEAAPSYGWRECSSLQSRQILLQI